MGLYFIFFIVIKESLLLYFSLLAVRTDYMGQGVMLGRGVSRIFERGGPISLGSLKKGHQILKGGVQWSEGGGPVHLSHYDDKFCIFRC